MKKNKKKWGGCDQKEMQKILKKKNAILLLNT